MSAELEALRDRGCLIVDGPDQPGIVTTVSALIGRRLGNIVSLDQYTDPDSGHFFQRVVFQRPFLRTALEEIESDLAATLVPMGLRWRLTDQSRPKRMAILASKADHCLLELLWRHRRGELPVEVPMVIANHRDTEEDVRSFGVPFHYVPSQRGDDKAQSEAGILSLLDGQVDFVVLARYMQILSGDFLSAVGVPVINIHHSFLPAFVGAAPYKRAKERGVKLIGATSHYVTQDLDEGPIIEQDIARVDHAYTAASLQARGAYVERAVLSRAVQWHAEDRVIRWGNQTIVF